MTPTQSTFANGTVTFRPEAGGKRVGQPLFIVWEQVPSVLPVWEACADVLRDHGYSVWTGNERTGYRLAYVDDLIVL